MRSKINSFLVFLLTSLFYLNIKAQSPVMDSLKLAFKQAKHDTTRCKILAVMVESDYDEKVWPVYNEQLKKLCENKLKGLSPSDPLYFFYSKYLASTLNNVGFIYDNKGDMPNAISYYNQALQIREKIKDYKGVAMSLVNIGTVYQFQGDIKKGLEYLEKALEIQTKIDDKHSMAYSLINIGLIESNQGNIPKALEYYHKSLKIREEINDKEGMAVSLTNIGFIYKRQGDTPKALEFYKKSLKIQEDMNDKRAAARSLNNIGSIYRDQNKIDMSLQYLNKSLSINEEIQDKRGIAASLTNLASIYKITNDPTCHLSKQECLKQARQKALEYYLRACQLFKESEDKKGVTGSLINISMVLYQLGRIKESLIYAQQGLTNARELGFPESIQNAAMSLKDIYQSQKKFEQALNMYELFVQMKDSIHNETTRKSSIRKQFQIEYEKEATKDSLENLSKIKEEQFKHEQEISVQRTYTYGGLIAFILMMIVAIVSFKAYKNKQKANIIITEQKQLADAQRHVIEEKQKEIIESITYAKRLQEAILPPANLLKKYLPKHFVLYKPKDIVAGDFYWFDKKDNITLIAAADSTGHGVPGAMVSVVCSNALHRAVNELGNIIPGKILDTTRELVLETFSKSESEVKDGMDISLLAINIEANEMKWSGAHNALWYIQHGELKEVKAHKQPIGKIDNPTPFPTHTIDLTGVEMVFLLTDGYADQFGGPNGKKFKYKPLETLLIKNYLLPVEEQYNTLQKTFDDWKRDLEQVDDVTIIGIQL